MLRRICHGLTLTLLVACSDDLSGPDPDPDPDPQPSASTALVSAPVAPVLAAGDVSSVRGGGSRVFVSMPPATEPGGVSVTLRVNDQDASVTAPMVDGGFDPVPVEAAAGDSLTVTVMRPSGAEAGYARVPAGSKPVVVRTSPRHRRVDVPLNPIVVVVFNEPMDPATLAPAISLRSAGLAIPGTVTAVLMGGDVLGAQFVPDGLLEAGTTYAVEVSAAAQNREGIPLGSPAQTEFTTGNFVTDATLVVNTTTSGSDIDPNGYDVVVDGTTPQPIDVNGTLSIPLAAGQHTVALAGATANCTVTDPIREVGVETGATVTVSFAVACRTPSSTGAVRVTTSTAGTDLDLDGYRISVDGAGTGTIGLNDAVVVTDLAAGEHTVTLSEVSRNCAAVDAQTRSVPVIAGATVDAAFDVTCTAVGTGTLVMTTSTTGTQLDADGYSISIDDGPPQPIGSNATISAVLPDTIPHSVFFTGVAGNCLPTDFWRAVSVSAGTSTVVAFEVECLEDVRPAGTIAFTTQTESAWSIFTSEADGSGRTRIASGTGQIGPLAWSPDGDRLAFSIATSSESADIFVVNADGSNLVRRTDTGRNESPTWSPDGRRVAFGSRRDNTAWSVYVMNVDEDWSNVARIGPFLPSDPGPAWSPDGTSIAFSHVISTASNLSGVWTMRPDGTGVVKLPGGQFSAVGRPAWSPDGATIAVGAMGYWDYGTSLWILKVNSSEYWVLPLTIEAWSPAWSPGGNLIAFQSCGFFDGCIGFATPDGRVSSVTIPDARDAVWRP